MHFCNYVQVFCCSHLQLCAGILLCTFVTVSGYFVVHFCNCVRVFCCSLLQLCAGILLCTFVTVCGYFVFTITTVCGYFVVHFCNWAAANEFTLLSHAYDSRCRLTSLTPMTHAADSHRSRCRLMLQTHTAHAADSRHCGIPEALPTLRKNCRPRTRRRPDSHRRPSNRLGDTTMMTACIRSSGSPAHHLQYRRRS